MIATKRTRSSLRVFFGMTCLLVVMTARAEERTEKLLIEDVISTGNLHVLTPRIVKMIKSQAGAEFKQDILDEDVRTLLLSKQFQDVQVQQQPVAGNKIRLYFRITEIPTTIQDIVFKGNRHAPPETLTRLSGLRIGAPLCLKEVEMARLAIHQHYKQVGREDTDVRVTEGDNLADERVVFTITESEHIEYRDALIPLPRVEDPDRTQEFDDLVAFERVRVGHIVGSGRRVIRRQAFLPEIEVVDPDILDEQGNPAVIYRESIKAMFGFGGTVAESGNSATRDRVILRQSLPRVPVPFPIP